MSERGVQPVAVEGGGRLVGSFLVVAVILLMACIGVVSAAALGAFEREVRPAIEGEAVVLGRIVAAPIERAVALGIPFSELSGVERYFEEAIAGHPNVAYLVMTNGDGLPAVRVGPAAASFEPPSYIAGTVGQDRQLRREVAVGFDTALAIGPGGQAPVGWLHVGISRAPVHRIVADTRWDVLIVLLVAAILAVELLRFVIDRTVTAPLDAVRRMLDRLGRGDCTMLGDEGAPDEAGRLAAATNGLVRRLHDRWRRVCWLAAEAAATGRDAAAGAEVILCRIGQRLVFRPEGPGLEAAVATRQAARLPLFLFVLAEQLSTSFIPLHGLELARGTDLGFGDSMLAAVPIAVFVAAVALATPHGGRLAARRGARATIVLGCVLAAVGYVWASVTESLPGFAFARGLCGIGYALVSIACQAQMAVSAAEGRMARSLGGFTGTVMTGAVCGTAIGAVLADRIGYGATFQVSVVLVVVVLLLAQRALPNAPPAARDESRGIIADARQAAASPAFAALVAFGAVPAKIVLAGFVFYLAPLALRDAGMSQAAIGRNVMLYGFCMLPAIVLGGWLADRANVGGTLIWFAGIANGVALLLPLAFMPDAALPAAIALTGIAQGIASAPMLAAVTAAPTDRDAPPLPVLLAFLRLGERVGSVIGPFLAAWLLAVVGIAQSIAWLGVVSALTAVGYAAVLAFGAMRTRKTA